MLKSTFGKVLRVACSALMAIAFVPAVSVESAFAAFGNEQFTEDGITYDIYSTTTIVNGVRLNNVHVTSLVYDGTDAVGVENGILEIPDYVTHDGVTYNVCSVDTNSLKNCTELTDLRIGDLGEGCLFASALTGCTSLQVIHFFGRAWINGSGFGSTTSVLSGVGGGLSIVLHDPAMNEGTLNNIPALSTVYEAVKFETGSTSATVYVRGTAKEEATGERNDSAKSIEGVTPSSFTKLSSADIFTDTDSASPLCTETVPSLPDGYDAWTMTHEWYSESESTRQAPDDAITGCGTATPCTITDLDAAVAHVPDSSLRVTGSPVDPQAYVIDALGNTIEASCLATSYYAWSDTDEDATADEIVESGKAIDLSEVVNEGTYAAKLTGVEGGGYTGTCCVEFTLSVGDVVLSRVTAVDRVARAQAAAANAYSFYKGIDAMAGVDVDGNGTGYGNDLYVCSKSLSKKFRIIVNPDDYAACIVADSIAGVLNCPVLSTESTGLSTEVKVNLASAYGATIIVVGSSTSIPNEIKSAAADISNGSSARIDGTSAAEMAVNAYSFITKCIEGYYPTIELEDEDYGASALILPQSTSLSAFSAAAWANASKAPILFFDENGALSSDEISILSSENIDNIVVAGASDTQQSAISLQLSDKNLTVWSPKDTEAKTSESYCDQAVSEGSLNYTDAVFCLDTDYGVLAATAASCGFASASLVIMDSTLDMSKYYATLWYGYFVATYEQLPQSAIEDYGKLWDDDVDNNLRFGTVSVADYKCTGSAVNPVVNVTSMNGTSLAENTDYTVTYRNNTTLEVVKRNQLINPGTYTVTVKGTSSVSDSSSGSLESGQYYGSRSTTFTITGTLPSTNNNTTKKIAKPVKVKGVVAKSKTKKTLTVTWYKALRATSYQIQWRIKGKAAWKSKTVKTRKVVLKKLTRKKIYQVRVRAKNTSGYGAWSVIRVRKVK